MRVMITGHRPAKIGGYQTPNPTEQWIRNQLRALLTGLKDRHPELTVVTGMAIGVDTIWAEEAVRLDIPFVVAAPFRGQERRWPGSSQQTYRRLLARACEVVYVDEVDGYAEPSLIGQMNSRNQWMVDHSDTTLAVWDGSKSGTRNAVEMAWRAGRSVLVLNPAELETSVHPPPV
jgi:uncharacterized phage-like protein YoqJ